jgi:ABC-2 type transport system ATP-binding protein
VYADLTVRENLLYFAGVLGAGGAAVAETLALVNLAPHERQLAATLSGGELARLSLAAALVHRPDVLVLDEPTVGLDPVLRRDLWSAFHRIADAGATVLVSSHVMDEADRCDALVLLRQGHVLATGTPESLRRRTGTAGLDDAFLVLVDGTADAT